MTTYTDLCREFVPACDPRHVEAWMRLEFGTLDHLSRDRFRREARMAEACIHRSGLRAV